MLWVAELGDILSAERDRDRAEGALGHWQPPNSKSGLAQFDIPPPPARAGSALPGSVSLLVRGTLSLNFPLKRLQCAAVTCSPWAHLQMCRHTIRGSTNKTPVWGTAQLRIREVYGSSSLKDFLTADRKDSVCFSKVDAILMHALSAEREETKQLFCSQLIHRHIPQWEGFWSWWRYSLSEVPAIVKLHLSFLADSKRRSFLKTKLQEIHVLRGKIPYILHLPTFSPYAGSLNCCRLLGFFSIVMQLKYIHIFIIIIAGSCKHKLKCFNIVEIRL